MPTCHDSTICNHFGESRPEVGSLVKIFTQKLPFWKKDPLRANFQKCFPKGFMATLSHVLCANFVKFGGPKVGETASCLPHKKSPRSLALASARIAPKICQGQRQTTYSECPKCYPNPFTSSGVIAERVNVVEMRHKVITILGEAIASSPSKNSQTTPK